MKLHWLEFSFSTPFSNKKEIFSINNYSVLLFYRTLSFASSTVGTTVIGPMQLNTKLNFCHFLYTTLF